MIYKRPERLKEKSSAKRNFILILLTVFLVIISYVIYANMSNDPFKNVIKFRAKKEVVVEPSNIPGGGGNSDVDVGEESDVKHKEVFVFSERDPNKSMKYDIFIYDSATGEKKQLTGINEKKQNESNTKYTKYYINPKFSSDGNTIYFVEGRDDTLKICSMDLNGENVKSIITTSKTNFSVSGSSIIYFEMFKNVMLHDIKTGNTKNLYSHTLRTIYSGTFPSSDKDTIEYDFPVVSKDKTKLYFVVKKQNGEYQIEKHSITDESTVIHSGYDRIVDMKLSPDDNYLLITFGTNVFKIFDIKEKKFIRNFSSDKGSRVTSATWSEDGKSVYWVRDAPYNNITKMGIEKEGQDSEVIVKDFVGYFIALKPEAAIGSGGGEDAPEPETFIYAAALPTDTDCTVIYSHTPSTGSKIQLTGTENDPNFKQTFWDSHPKYSPDGNTIAFCRTEGGTAMALRILHIMNADGTDIRALVNVYDCKTNCFSADSKALFYVNSSGYLCSINLEIGTIDANISDDSSRYTLTYPIYVEEPETESKFVYYFQFKVYHGFHLNRISLNDESTVETLLDHLDFDLNSVALSPDSSKLLLNTNNPGETFIFNLKTNELTKNPVVHSVNIPSALWSNDGKSIYFYLDHPSNKLVKHDADKINLDDMVVTLDNIPFINGISLKPPSRNEILIYSENQDSSSKSIVSHNLRTGIKNNLTQNYHDTSPKITSDMNAIFFCRQMMDTKKYLLYRMDVDGKNLKKIENSVLRYCDFNLSNDGKNIIFKARTGEIWSIGFENGLTETLNAKGNLPTMSFDGNFLYFVDGKKLFRKKFVDVSGVIELVNEFEREIKSYRLSHDGTYAAVLYGNIVTVISLNSAPGQANIFIPIMDEECPIEDVIWSHDSKWLYLRRGLPKKDLIRINTRDFDITKAELVLDKCETDSCTQIIPIK